MSDCKPIAVKSRNYSQADQEFIAIEMSKLLKDGIIKPNSSLWRAQIVVVTNDNHKKKLCIDYSQTVNKFALLDTLLTCYQVSRR